MKKQWLSWVVKLGGSALILWLLFRFIEFDYEGFVNQLSNLNLSKYFISLSGVIIVLAVKSFRWQRIILNEGTHYPVFKSFGAYMASYTIGIITPGRIGEIARLYYLRQHSNTGFLLAFRTIVTDRIFDLGVLVMMALGGLLHFGPLRIENVYMAVMIAVLFFFTAMYSTFWLLNLLRKRKQLSENRLIVFLWDTIRPAIGKQSIVLWLITVVAYILFYAAISFIFQSLSIQLQLIDIAIVLSVVGLATILPISWAGFGTREMTLVYLLSFYGISAETALSFSLLQFVAFFLWGSLVGLVFWVLMPVSLSKIQEDSKLLQQMLKKKKSQSAELE